MTRVNNFGERLKGRYVFLSASVPTLDRGKRFSQIADAPFHIEQAVISLARAVFSEGGSLVFGGHPSISPLVSIVAGEYREPNLAEGGGERARPQVSIYQSEAFREHISQDTALLFRLGLAEQRWVKAIGGERFVPGKGSAHNQCPRSLEAMRSHMIKETDPAAMICVGGMDGVLDEAHMFGQTGRPIFALRHTGGAASILADQGDAVPIDIQVENEVITRLDKKFEMREGGIQVRPYPLIMQTVVDRIVPPTKEKARDG